MLCRFGIHKVRKARRWHEDMFVCAYCRRCKCVITIRVLGCE